MLRNKDIPDLDLPKKVRTSRFYKAAKRLAKFVGTLPLTDEQRVKLFKLLADQVHEAESAAACQGAQLGIEHMVSELERFTTVGR